MFDFYSINMDSTKKIFDFYSINMDSTKKCLFLHHKHGQY
jgi:hypothetical protein